LPIKNIKKNDIILKAGYICNILVYGIIYNDNTDENIILKISNLDNELANTARKLNLYKNELYFYKELSHLINIKIPKYYNSFMNNNREGILMEDMNKYVGKFDLNLNKNITILLKIVENVFKMHNKYYFDREENILPIMNKLKKINEISYYKSLIQDRFKIFIEKNEKILCLKDKKKLIEIFENFESIINKSSQFPLSFCHGDLKSPNIFFKEDTEPYFLDWQYIHLNKGISDIVFLLVESIEFDKITVDLVINYYYKLLKEARNISYEDFMIDVKNSLCIFPFFVCVWFNSENSDKLLDPVFPIRFMKNLLLYYNYYL
jgi:thiamine kinase-like enzyme